MPAVVDQLRAQALRHAGFDFKPHDESVQHARARQIKLLRNGQRTRHHANARVGHALGVIVVFERMGGHGIEVARQR